MAYTIRQKPASTSNYTKGRAGNKINKIVIHHAATTDFDGIARTFQNPAKKVSAHYGVGRDNNVDVYVQEANCFPLDNTEVLTPNGFKPLSEFKVGDEVYQYDQNNYNVTKTKVNYVVPVRQEEVYKMRKTEATIAHDMLVKKTNGTLKKIFWGEVLQGRYELPNRIIYKARKNGVQSVGQRISSKLNSLSEPMLRLLVAIQADGYYTADGAITFRFKKERKINRILDILSQINHLTFTSNEQSDGSTIIRIKTGNQKIRIIKEIMPDKTFTKEFIELDESHSRWFIDEVKYWDSVYGLNTIGYSTADKANADILQINLLWNSLLSNVQTVAESETRKKENRVYVNEQYWLSEESSRNKRIADVSCISVDTGNIIIRQYGQIQIVGNCAWHAGNRNANYTSIGIENVNSTGDPTWDVAESTFNTLVELTRDVAMRNNLLPLVVGKNLFQHKDFSPTYCAGKLGDRLGELANRVNDLTNAPAPAPTPTPTPPAPSKPATDAFLGSRGYLRRGDSGANIGRMNRWFRSTFPAYAPASVLGNFFGPITERTVKEFQRRAKADGRYNDIADGYVGPLTLKAMKSYGFKG